MDLCLSETDENGTVNGNDPELVFKIDFIIDAKGHPFSSKI